MPSPFLYSPPAITQPVIIRNDGGGRVDQYMEQARVYNIEGRRVEIRGSCRSACLLALSVKNVCVSHAAQVSAHQAYNEITGERRPDITNKMLNELPPKIHDRLYGKVQNDYTEESILNYSELRSLGVPDCDSNKSIRASDNPKPSKPAKITYRIATPIDGLLSLFPFLKGRK